MTNSRMDDGGSSAMSQWELLNTESYWRLCDAANIIMYVIDFGLVLPLSTSASCVSAVHDDAAAGQMTDIDANESPHFLLGRLYAKPCLS